jgi:translocation protein SEC63
MLEYDNSAFYYFSITLLTIYLLPGYYYLLKELWLAFVRGASKSDGTAARTALEKDKASKIRGRVQGLARLRHWTFLANLTTLVLATALFVYLINLVISDGEVSTFDPYQILGIEMGSSVAEIKRQYRKLSLKFHPDKNVGSKVAEEMFMKIAKAYEALTDETSKENYEKYGNPDGKQSLEVSIGLPSVILDNPKVVLVLYLVAMVVVIPVAVGVWYSNSKQFGEKNILYESYTAFYQLLTEQHRVKLMPEVMAASAESRRINAPRAEDAEQLLALKNKMKSEKLMQKPKFEHPQILKGNLLLHCHVLRMTADLSPVLPNFLSTFLTSRLMAVV